MKNDIDENTFTCQYCGLSYDTEQELEDHVLSMHYKEVEENLSKIEELAQEHKETIQEWKDQKKKEFLLKISQERLQLLHEIQCSPHSEEMLNKMVEEELFRESLRTNTASSFDLMWMKHPKFQEIYEEEKKKKKREEHPCPCEEDDEEDTYEHKDESTGKSETFWESPDVMIKQTDKENLSTEDRKKLELIKILFSLTRSRDLKKKN